MKNIFHVVGTDTDIGKTYATCQLIRYSIKNGINANGIKPVATGTCPITSLNSDAQQLINVNASNLPPEIVNPIVFDDAVAPHIAATYAENLLTKQILKRHVTFSLGTTPHGNVFIEGVGGIMVPLNESETYLDFLKAMPYPIIVVVGIKLGCLNHAQLTILALQQSGLNVAGWVANYIQPDMSYLEENVQFLQDKLTVPYLASIGFNRSICASQALKELLLCN